MSLNPLRILSLCCAATLLSACLSSVLPKTAPRATHVLPAAPLQASARSLPGAIWVEAPHAIAPQDSRDVIVLRGDGEAQTLPGAAWADRAPVLMQDLLARSLESSRAAEVVVQSPAAHAVRWRLSSELRAFELHLQPDGRLQARVALSARLICVPLARVHSEQRFHIDGPAGPATATAATQAMAAAAAQMTADLVIWLDGVDATGCALD